MRGDPRFLAPYDVRLRAGSPALGTGVPVPGGGDRDFYGNPCPTRRTSAPTKDGGSRPNLVVPRPQLGNYLRA
ncbi:hypothetical protein ACH4NT_32675 [Streptomyces lydicus]|uniref:hypothetical protein n=1 Tax=Streptomyces lydicus TaxID=47763 RepID=UPI0037B92F3B